MPAAKAILVDDGVFRGFLTSRSPIPGDHAGNGHGRRSPGRAPTARMGNTVVAASRTHNDAQMRALMIQQLRRAKLPYGYIVDQIDGGFTMTGRVVPNAFNVRATTTWKVFTDGRPDELVRGIDLVGTPLLAFQNLIAAGDQPEVFNGTCGAESGWVPVSGVAPSLLFSELEFQLKEKGFERPPLLPRATPQLDAEKPDEVGRVLKRAVQRHMDGLRLPGSPAIYHLRYGLLDLQRVEVLASLGEAVRMDERPSHSLGVEVRVGDFSFDNTGLQMGPGGFSRISLPLELNQTTVGRAAWRVTDSAYKQSVEQFARKQARVTEVDGATPAYTPAEPSVAALAPSATPWSMQDAARWAKNASGHLSAPHEGWWRGEVHVGQEAGYWRVIDSEGSDVAHPQEEISIRALVALRAEDGALLTDQAFWTVRDATHLPSDAQVQAELGKIRDNVLRAANAPPLKRAYVGPVVFEDSAASDVFRYVLTPQLEANLSKVEFDTSFSFDSSPDLKARVGRRALPVGWSAKDDPRALPNHPSWFTHDTEGTPTQATTLVEDGLVQSLVTSRSPHPDAPVSNGHARGSVGQRQPGRIAQLTVVPPKRHRSSQLYKKALGLAKAYHRDWFVVVRRLQEPGVRFVDDEVYASIFDGELELPQPVFLVKRFADGHEELLRGGRIQLAAHLLAEGHRRGRASGRVFLPCVVVPRRGICFGHGRPRDMDFDPRGLDRRA